MPCPRCQAAVASSALFCPSCHFSMSAADARYGSEVVIADRVTDRAHGLPQGAAAGIAARLDAFEAEFPQLFLALHIDAHPEGAKLGEFAFWFLNRAAVSGLDFNRPNEAGIVLCIDVNSRSAAVATGYALEAALPPTKLRKLLGSAHELWWDGDFQGGIGAFIDALSARLRQAGSRQRHRDPERPPRWAREAPPTDAPLNSPPGTPESRPPHDAFPWPEEDDRLQP